MSESNNVGLAFGLTFAASLSTTIGAAAAFFARLQDRLVLAGSLGCSAGVMLYVSFVEIFDESRKQFAEAAEEADSEHSSPLMLTTVFFFLGMVIIAILDAVVHMLEHKANVDECPHLPTMHMDAVLEHHADKLNTEKRGRKGSKKSTATVVEMPALEVAIDADSHAVADKEREEADIEGRSGERQLSEVETVVVKKMIAENDRDLKRASLITAFAVGLHNLPEGLATFVSTLADPKIGLSVSIAIAIHNIPEGLCVAMPLFFATGSRWKAFLWATLSGVSEFLGAVIGYTVLREHFSPFVYGVVFGLVGGMMVFVSFRELLPVARRYDPEDKVVSFALVGGMGIMALSLVLFDIQ